MSEKQRAPPLPPPRAKRTRRVLQATIPPTLPPRQALCSTLHTDHSLESLQQPHGGGGPVVIPLRDEETEAQGDEEMNLNPARAGISTRFGPEFESLGPSSGCCAALFPGQRFSLKEATAAQTTLARALSRMSF